MEEYTNDMVLMEMENSQAKTEFLKGKYKTVKARDEKNKKKKPAKHAEKLYLSKRRPKRHKAKKVEVVEIEEKKPEMDVYVYFDMTSPEAKQKMEMNR